MKKPPIGQLLSLTMLVINNMRWILHMSGWATPLMTEIIQLLFTQRRTSSYLMQKTKTTNCLQMVKSQVNSLETLTLQI